MRIVLGASRRRLVRFVLMEALLLSGFGVALGLALAYTALRVMQTLEISGIPRLADASLNLWVLGFATITAVLTGLLSGLAPTLQALSSGVAAPLRDSDRQKGSRRQGRLRAGLVTAEVALSFILLVGAGLLIRSFAQLTSVNHGFQTENRLVFSVSMPGSYGENGVGKAVLGSLLRPPVRRSRSNNGRSGEPPARRGRQSRNGHRFQLLCRRPRSRKRHRGPDGASLRPITLRQ